MTKLYTDLIFILIILSVECTKYHTNIELEMFLKNFSDTITNGLKTKLYSIGQSSKKTNLWVLEITALKSEKIGVPNIKLLGNIHGNEPIGRELLLYFLEFLRDQYNQNDPEITWLLENSKIHILPTLNPDGFELSQESECYGEKIRNNGVHGFDLNRNFPDLDSKITFPEQPETKAVRKWMRNTSFILSAALHGGAMVANYPFDSILRTDYDPNKSKMENDEVPTEDDDVFRHLAQTYALNHLTMHTGVVCPKSDKKFEGGITNGAEWYSLEGGMQDYNYVFHGCMELTLEISCCKYPNASELPELWEENKKALLKYCMEALKGVTGQILDSVTLKPIVGASLQISGRNMTFLSSRTGEFWRLLLPGEYKLKILAKGYYTASESFIVKKYENSFPRLTNLTILLVNSNISTTRPTTTSENFETGTTEGAPYILSRKFQNVNSRAPTAERLQNKAEQNICCTYLLVYFISFVSFIQLF